MKKFCFLTALILTISACSFDIIDKNLSPMIGSQVDVAISRLGYPDAESSVAGKKFYVWEAQTSGSYSVPSVSYVGNTPITTFSTNFYNYDCRIRIFVNESETITHYDFKGNEGGCSYLASRLEN